MARAPNEKVNEAYSLYKKGYKLVEISKKLDVPDGTVRRWKKTYSWDNERSEKQSERSQKNEKSIKSKGGQPKNKNAEKFGFFSKYLPEETVNIMDEMMTKDPLDILWEQITIQYTAIIRAQRIMYVESKEEMIKELKKEEYTADGDSKLEYEFQFAWDRQATFLNAQTRAMGELRSLIKQYDIMLNSNWSLATGEQKLRIEKLKLDISNIKGDSKDNSGENWANTLIEIAKRRKERGNSNG